MLVWHLLVAYSVQIDFTNIYLLFPPLIRYPCLSYFRIPLIPNIHTQWMECLGADITLLHLIKDFKFKILTELLEFIKVKNTKFIKI